MRKNELKKFLVATSVDLLILLIIIYYQVAMGTRLDMTHLKSVAINNFFLPFMVCRFIVNFYLFSSLNKNGRFLKMKEVDPSALLGRPQVDLNRKDIGGYIKNRVVLVTGAGGSIGSELCFQIGGFSPRVIVLLERAESHLYDIDIALKKQFSHVKIVPQLADIQSRKQLEGIFRRYEPAIVFHAAAYKHVPILESHPWKAVKNNIAGTINVVETSKKFNADRFVLVSTDKAVCPTNVMGASKRIAEMIVQNQNKDNSISTKFMTVRFGNVIGSSGSVIPLFQKQIAEGGPVTVTHPDVTRFFMTTREACQLILQAGSMTKGGEIYILDMGEPVNILSMAVDLVKQSGFTEGKDMEIVFTGLRPGEKLYEELVISGELTMKTDHAKIMILKSFVMDRAFLNKNIHELITAAKKQNPSDIRARMKVIVPEYIPDTSYDNVDVENFPENITISGKRTGTVVSII